MITMRAGHPAMETLKVNPESAAELSIKSQVAALVEREVDEPKETTTADTPIAWGARTGNTVQLTTAVGKYPKGKVLDITSIFTNGAINACGRGDDDLSVVLNASEYQVAGAAADYQGNRSSTPLAVPNGAETTTKKPPQADEPSVEAPPTARLDKHGYLTGFGHQTDDHFAPLAPPHSPIVPKHSHYFKPCPFPHVDVYRVLSLFSVTDPCLQHAVKKLLVAGARGHKDIGRDVQDVIDTLTRWQDMRVEERAAQ
ncbi:MAG: hypothetical protein WDN30_14385 [Pararobbsia sp.]